MGYVKNKIKELSAEAGSKKKARSNAESWYNSSLRDRSVKEAKYTRSRFQPGKIYVFGYDPITENLEWFDRNPIVLALEQVDDNDLGVNLNLLPIRVKEDLLEDDTLIRNNISEELTRLNDLFQSGAITEEEFKKAKEKILDK